MVKDSQPLSWHCDVCKVTIFSLYSKQFKQNVASHKKSKKHKNKAARATARVVQ
jgi:hypothetical protein